MSVSIQTTPDPTPRLDSTPKSTSATSDIADDEISGQRLSLPRWVPLEDDAKTMYSVTVPQIDEQTIAPEELNPEDLENCICVMEQSNTTLKAENNLLENYLSAVDPSLIENMDRILDAATAAIHKAERNVQLGVMASATTLSQTSKGGQESTFSSPRSHTGTSSKIATFTMSDKGPKVQPSQKIEIIQREIDIIKEGFDDYLTRSNKIIFALECRQEECIIQSRELESTRKSFELSLTKEWIDPISRKVPGEKIIEYFENKIRTDTQQKKFFQARAKNFNIQHDAVLARLRELGEGLHYVDYEQLVIQKEEVEKQLASHSAILSNLNKTNTCYLEALNTTSDHIIDNIQKTKMLEKNILKKDMRMMKLFRDESRILNDMDLRQKRINDMVSLLKKYTAPDVMDYVRHCAELNSLKKALKAAERKNNFYEERYLRKPNNKVEITNKKKLIRTKSGLYRGSNNWKPLTSNNDNKSE